MIELTTAAAEQTRPFWSELRALRARGVARGELRRAVDLAGAAFCRAALCDERPFARGCEQEARGLRGELRQAVVCLAAAGGRKVAHELARRRGAELRAAARDTAAPDGDELAELVERLGREEVRRRLDGDVGFGSACLYEAALRGLHYPAAEADWARLAACAPAAVRQSLAARERPQTVGREGAVAAGAVAASEPAPADPAPDPAAQTGRRIDAWQAVVVKAPAEVERPAPTQSRRLAPGAGAVLVRSFGDGGGESPLAEAMREALAEAG